VIVNLSEQLDQLNGSGSVSRTTIVPMNVNVQDVGRIVGGEAISDLASAVKELFNNALHTGATTATSRIRVLYI